MVFKASKKEGHFLKPFLLLLDCKLLLVFFKLLFIVFVILLSCESKWYFKFDNFLGL